LIETALAHCPNSGLPHESTLRAALFCVDELTGLIAAAAKVNPAGLAAVKPSSVRKKFKDKAFAAAVDRDLIQQCEPLLGIELAKFIELTLAAMKEKAEELGI